MSASSLRLWRRPSSSVLAVSALLALALESAPRAQCSDEAVLHYLDAGTVAPVLRTPKGAAVIGGGFSLRVFDAAPSSTGFLFYSAFENPTFDPVLGATIWPTTPWLVKPFGTSALGVSGAQFNAAVVTDDLCGAFATFQAVVVDPGSSSGFTVSNAVRLRVGSVDNPLFAPVAGNGSIPTLANVNDVDLVDVNGDALRDLLAATSSSFIVRPRLPNGAFGPATTYSLLGGASRVPLVADMNSDGNSDLVNPWGSVGVLLLDAAGGVIGAANYSTGGAALDGAVGDIDLDGFLDTVVTLAVGDLGWMRGNGSGGLMLLQDIDVGAGASAVETAHMDHDGNLDLVVSTSGTVVALGNGDGTFVASAPVGPAGLGLLSVRDLDGDGELDVTGFSGKTLGVQRGNGDGTLLPFQGHVAAGHFVKDYAFEDLDGDGRSELIAIPGHISIENVFVSAGLPGGAFAPALEYGGTFRPGAVVVMDDDQDGATDVVVLGATTTLTLLGNGDGTLRASRVIAAGKYSTATIAADLDGNALDDVILLNGLSDDFSVILSTPDGPVLSGTYPVSAFPTDLVAGDLDGDQSLDVLTSDAVVTQLRAYPGNGSGGFGSPITTSISFNVEKILLADFDEDGVLDVVAERFSSTKPAEVALGNGNGTFGASTPLPITKGDLGVVGRVDGDAHIDIVVFWLGNGTTLLGNGDGTFVALPLGPLDSSYLMKLADVDLDGRQDLLGVHTSGNSNILGVELGVGDGTFVHAQTISIGLYASQDPIVGFVVADFDENGIPDVIASDRGVTEEGSLRWLRGNGDGTFTTALLFPTGFAVRNVVAGDFDGDGVRDIAQIDTQANQGTAKHPSRVWFLLNQVGE